MGSMVSLSGHREMQYYAALADAVEGPYASPDQLFRIIHRLGWPLRDVLIQTTAEPEWRPMWLCEEFAPLLKAEALKSDAGWSSAAPMQAFDSEKAQRQRRDLWFFAGVGAVILLVASFLWHDYRQDREAAADKLARQRVSDRADRREAAALEAKRREELRLLCARKFGLKVRVLNVEPKKVDGIDGLLFIIDYPNGRARRGWQAFGLHSAKPKGNPIMGL